MAIVIEEEQRSSSVNIVSLVIWIFALAALGLAAYYLFFKRPELIPITVPQNFKNTEELSNIELRAEDILSNLEFKNLQNHVTPLQPGSVGRSNPLLGF